jgi:hypothetical protein
MPTRPAVVHTDDPDSSRAGADLGHRIRERLGGDRPQAVILFASPRYDLERLLRAVHEACEPEILVGSSSAGEFTNTVQGDGLACAIALHAPEMRFASGVGRRLGSDRSGAARSMVGTFLGMQDHAYAHRAALIMADALAGHADELVTELDTLTGGLYTLFGGGAGGDAQFQNRYVFHGTEVIADGAVALEILSNKPLGLGVGHGWKPSGPALRVTEASGTRLGSLDAIPAAEVFEEHAERTGQVFERQDPMPFFLHNVIGIDTGSGHKLRVPLAVDAEGAVTCATEVPGGSTVSLMSVNTADAAAAAATSAKDAVSNLGGHEPAVALFFDCVATRLRMGKDFGFELDAVRGALGGAPFAGCNSIGQIARAEGEVGGFHNCTAVVCVIPR